MGFVDLSGSLGRYFGSIGIGLDEIYIRLSLTAANELTLSGLVSARAEKCLKHFCRVLNVSDCLNLHLDNNIPEHVGLGSGTQMALAIGSALNAYYDLGLSVREIAQLSDRGRRSGIGIGIFEHGGLVVDGGHGEFTQTPPVISRLAVPEAWRFILVFDHRGQGLHGEQEITAFKKLPPFPHHEAAQLCYLLLMQGLPAVAENNLAQFGAFISRLQLSVGEYFAAAQGGGLFTSTEVGAVMTWLERQGAVAIGQTSWGPTGFCAVANTDIAEDLVLQLSQQFAHIKQLSFCIARTRNKGAEISIA
jgi:beta-ribofuranosylaminobenzene 5'-phosphate synthase